MKPVTVIMPLRNCEKYVKEALDSIDFKLADCIVVDDRSTDDSAKIAVKYPVLFIEQSYHRGQGYGKNIALEVALRLYKSPYIMFLDSDDYYSDGCIEKMLNAVDGHQLAVCNTRTFGDFPREYGKLKLSGSYVLDKDTSMKTPVVAWNKIYESSTLEKIRFPNSIPEDNPFWFTYCCQNEGIKVNYIDDVLCNYRQIETSSYNKQNRGANEFCSPVDSYVYMHNWLKDNKPNKELFDWLESSYLENMINLHSKVTGLDIETVRTIMSEKLGGKNG